MDWGLTNEEFVAVKKKLGERISFESIFNKKSSAQPLYSSSWTHRGCCPNPNHKQGNERSASFYFNEKSKEFHCFGCQWNGDVFDFLSIFMATPAKILVEDLINKQNLNLEKILGAAPSARKADNFEIKHELGLTLRDFLVSKTDTASYEDHKKWVDSIFKRIDDRFVGLGSEDTVGAQNFSNQILLELDRRKV